MDALPRDSQEVNLLARFFFCLFFSFPENACLGISFCLTSLCLQPLSYKAIIGQRSLDWRTICSYTHSGPSLLFCNTTC